MSTELSSPALASDLHAARDHDRHAATKVASTTATKSNASRMFRLSRLHCSVYYFLQIFYPCLALQLRSHPPLPSMPVLCPCAREQRLTLAVDDDGAEPLSPIVSRRPPSRHSRSTGPPVSKDNQSAKNSLKLSTSNPSHNSGLDPLSTVSPSAPSRIAPC